MKKINVFKKVLVFLLFSFAMFAFVGGVQKVKAADFLYQSVGFESSESFETGTDYQGTVTSGATGKQWTIYYGNFSTSSKITGNNSAALRLYTSNNYGYLVMNYDLANITKVVYNAKASTSNSAKIKLNTYYSIDSGDTWTKVNTDLSIASTATSYTIQINESGTDEKVRIKFEISNNSTKPSKSSAQLTIDDIDFYQKIACPALSNPSNASINNNVLTFNAVQNASSYNIGFFADENAESATKVINVTSTSYEIPFQSTDGNNFVKVQAVGDYVNYSNSEYVDVGLFTNETITALSLKQAVDAITEDAAPYTYYQITGRVESIQYSTNSSIYITDGTYSQYIYTISATKGGSPASVSTLNINVGDTVTIIGYKSIYKSTVEWLGSYLVSVTPNYLNQFKSLKTIGSLKVDYSQTLGGSTTYWEKVIDDNDLAVDDQIIVVYDATEKVMTSQSGDYRLSANITIDSVNNRILSIADTGAQVITLELGYVDGSFAFNVASDEYLYSSAAKKLLTGSEKNSNSYSFVVNIVNGETKIICKTFDDQENKLQYNTGSPRFCCYTTSQGSISIYKLVTKNVWNFSIKQNQNSKNEVSLFFGQKISYNLKSGLENMSNFEEFGMFYISSSILKGNTIQDWLDTIDDTITISELKDMGLHQYRTSLVQVDESGVKSLTGTYYQFGAAIDHIPSSFFDDEVTAACYVLVDGVYYIMAEKTWSVNSIAAYYISNEVKDKSSYVEHLSMLSWLSTYHE